MREQAHFLPRDVYHRWKRLVAESEASITIFTPYLDRLIDSLLPPKVVQKVEATIVTTLDAAHHIQTPGQLKAMKRASGRGVSVLVLDRLHAKVLLVDDDALTVGSQNFTGYGRRSKECSVVVHRGMRDSEIVRSLVAWRSLAQPIDVVLLDELIKRLRPYAIEHKSIVAAAHEAVTSARDRWAEQLRLREDQAKRARLDSQRHMIERLEVLQEASETKLADTFVWARRVALSSGHGYYQSLVVDRGTSLTTWVTLDDSGTYRPFGLVRLQFYPVLIANTGRLFFGRVGKTRITYARDGVRWNLKWTDLSTTSVEITVRLPETDTELRNIIFLLQHPYRGGLEIDALFDGSNVQRIAVRTTGQPQYGEAHIADELISYLEEDAARWSKLFSDSLVHFRYAQLRRDDKDLNHYLTDYRYRIGLIEYRGIHFLVARGF